MRQFNQQVQEWISLPRDRLDQLPHPPASPLNSVGSNLAICMWDGAMRNGSHEVDGMVILNSDKAAILAKGIQFLVLDDPMIIEILVLREAIACCLECEFTAMRFEGDAQVIIEKILRNDVRDNRVGAILEEIVNSFAVNMGFNVRFVGRRNNRVAHLVARKALSLFPTTCRSFDFQAWLNSRM
ncbi:unnamed protein product [Linum trigynum]|uniref:RNase H type-1 domain-containing protein n=1 Tax=Linum trigynum TaxID=586398 RepID=A0AAV2GJS4_9ROSI